MACKCEMFDPYLVAALFVQECWSPETNGHPGPPLQTHPLCQDLPPPPNPVASRFWQQNNNAVESQEEDLLSPELSPAVFSLNKK